jgi:hypothetical protein
MRAALVLACLALAGCRSAAGTSGRGPSDPGYQEGVADEVKRLYWAKQALEAPRGGTPAGRTQYYTWVDPGAASDGRRLAPGTLAVPVFIPAPVPSGADSP